MKSFIGFCGNIPSVIFNLSFSLEKSRDFITTTCFHVCFSNALPRWKYGNLVCSIICIWLEGNIFSPGRYSYLPTFPDDNADIFAASMLMWYCYFSSLILSSIVMIVMASILYPIFLLKRKELPVARVACITKKENGFEVHFLYRFTKSSKSISE